MGEPILTAQPFYFLERLDSVVKVRFEAGQDIPSERTIEYVIDNYLFEYSKLHPADKVTSKITELQFWKDNPDYHYFEYDWRMTQCLVLDTYNDSSILNCSDAHHINKNSFYDWLLFKEYFDQAHDLYVQSLRKAASLQVSVRTSDHSSLGTGMFTLPILKTLSPPLTLEQVERFEVLSPNEIKHDQSSVLISRGIPSSNNFEIPVESISAQTHYNAELLAYYFSGLRDHSPVSQFKNFYNVLEYFFEVAPASLGISASYEYQQIEAVLRWAITSAELSSRLGALKASIRSTITRPQTTTSGEPISPLNLASTDILKEYAGRIYQFRNACVHSKKTRRGAPTARIVPSTENEEILSHEMGIVQWLATKCIERELTP